MAFKNTVGFILGAISVALSKFFWLDTCEYVSNSLGSIELSTCNGFSDFFFWIGIVSMVFSVIGFIKDRF